MDQDQSPPVTSTQIGDAYNTSTGPEANQSQTYPRPSIQRNPTHRSHNRSVKHMYALSLEFGTHIQSSFVGQLPVPTRRNADTACKACGQICGTDAIARILQAETREVQAWNRATDAGAAIFGRSAESHDILLVRRHLGNEPLCQGVGLLPGDATIAVASSKSVH